MIKVKTIHEEVVVTPSIFPDGTSQVWKLPEELLTRHEYIITWNFEAEREIVDLCSLTSLLPVEAHVKLHVPYIPYGRQDKKVGNKETFNLYVLSQFINLCHFDEITTIDAHNPERFEFLFKNAKNLSVYPVQEKVVYDFAPTFVVFPDKGAMSRYSSNLLHINTIFCDKIRDQSTGNITGLKLNFPEFRPATGHNVKFLIVDDICDGGATFIAVAKALRESFEFKDLNVEVGLFVTHGIFSKGRQHLLDNGIDKIYTTNSLLKNEDGYKV